MLTSALSATGYLYTYPLMEPHPFAQQMQQGMIRETEAVQPKFLVLVTVPHSWLARPDSKNLIFQWGIAFARQHYRPAGLPELVSPTRSLVVWGAEACAAYLQQAVSATAKRVYLLRRNLALLFALAAAASRGRLAVRWQRCAPGAQHALEAQFVSTGARMPSPTCHRVAMS
jgi:hypothetical protein